MPLQGYWYAMTGQAYPTSGPTVFMPPAQASRYLQIIAAMQREQRPPSPAEWEEVRQAEAAGQAIRNTLTAAEQARYLQIIAAEKQYEALGQTLGQGDFAEFDGYQTRIGQAVWDTATGTYAAPPVITPADPGTGIGIAPPAPIDPHPWEPPAGGGPIVPIIPPPTTPPPTTPPPTTPPPTTPPPPTPPPPPGVNPLGRAGQRVTGVATIANPHERDNPDLGYEPDPSDPNYAAWLAAHPGGGPAPTGQQTATATGASNTASQAAGSSWGGGSAQAQAPVGVPAAAATAQSVESQGQNARVSAPTSTPLLSGAGQQAPTDHFNYTPMGDGSWTMHPPGVTAPAVGVQGSFPEMASTEQLQGLGSAMRRQFGSQPSPGATGV